jgi:hypothetical protein
MNLHLGTYWLGTWRAWRVGFQWRVGFWKEMGFQWRVGFWKEMGFQWRVGFWKEMGFQWRVGLESLMGSSGQNLDTLLLKSTRLKWFR